MDDSLKNKDLLDLLIVLDERDNVGTARSTIRRGTYSLDGCPVRIDDDIRAGFKVALCEIPSGASIIKYGGSIGTAGRIIPAGRLVHTHNMRSNLSTHDQGL